MKITSTICEQDSPEIKRFVNQDVLLGNIAEGQSLNRFAFVTGNPVSFVDPFGLSSEFGEDDIASLTLDFIPVVGSCKGAVEFVIGADPITGESISRWVALIGIVPFGKYFTKGKATYEILDGVRRAKAADLVGKQSIRAEVYENEKLINTIDVSIDSLLSPNKSSCVH